MKPTMSLIVAFLFLELFAIPTSNIGFCDGSSLVSCIQSERQALLRFKEDLNDSSSQLASWTGHGDCCTWAGVVCDNFTGHVLELHLRSSLGGVYYDDFYSNDTYEASMRLKLREASMRLKLHGKLNPSLLNLKQLIYLDLSYNNFEGIQIPKFLGSMRNLRYLDLSSSGFLGKIPQQLGNLSNLQYLDLRWNPKLVVENFYWLSGLFLLKHLDLSYVDLSKASDWLSVSNTLPSLAVLLLSGCQLDHLPPLPVANFSSLATLDLSDNNFNNSLIHRWIFGLSHLVFLDLQNNKFRGLILDELQNLTFLRYLDLSNTDLKDSTCIKCLSKLKHLEYLSLSGNKLQGAILGGLGNLTSIKILDLSSNIFLEGRVPGSWGNFCQLSSISLSNSNFSQGISEILDIFSGCVSKTLEHLDLSNSQSFGSLTNLLGKFQNLKFLSLAQNSISGHIVLSIGNLSSLVSLDVSHNQLTNSIPLSIGELSYLVHLDVSSNNLSESIPSSLGNLSSLISLDFSNNSLSGSIPSSLGKLSSLEYLDVRYNLLSGSLPLSLGMLSSLVHLFLLYNNLEESLPLSLGNMSSLIEIDVSYNQLSGSIPQSLGNLSSLEVLDLSFNKLNGSLLPIHFVSLTSLYSFIAPGNSLTMKVHPDWVPPFQLRWLDLQSWHLGPQFPLWLISQNSLEHLDISNAGIVGTIPSKFGRSFSSFIPREHQNPYLPLLPYHQFRSLNLSHNQIYGVIPNLSMVSMLDLSWNNLSCSSLRSSHLNVRGLLDLSNNLLFGSCLHHSLCDEEMEVEILNLENNFLSGELPDCWSKWTSLSVLKLNNNKFTGSIPISFRSLSSLKSLQLRNNSFSGAISVSLSNCTELVILDISENKFVGNVPQWIGERFSSLSILNFRSNNFHGPLPKGLCHLVSLQVLDFAHNYLSGTIPRCVNNLTNMVATKNFNGSEHYEYEFGHLSPYMREDSHDFYFSDEVELMIKGKLSAFKTILYLVRSVDLSNNKFSGEIPIEITNLIALQSLNLSYNLFIGRIPENIGSMRSLESIDFSENHLCGEIPQSMSTLTFLSHLNLSNNNLTGKIPLSTQLQSFDLSSFVGNDLCGSPLLKNCTAMIPTPNFGSGEGKDGNEHEVNWFYVSMTLGFIVGFWSVIGSLIVNRRWRYKYCHFLDQLGDKFVCVVRKCS